MGEEDRILFQTLYEKYVRELLQYAKRWVDGYLAEDLVEETFLAAWSNIRKLHTHPSPRKWLYVTLNHKCSHEVNRKSFRMEVPTEIDKLGYAAAGGDQGLMEILPKGLSEKEIQLLKWRYEERYDFIEIAEYLAIREDAARKRVLRAVEHCRRLIIDHHVSDTYVKK